MPTVRELKNLFRQARIDTGLFVPYSMMRKNELLQTAYEVGLLFDEAKAREERLNRDPKQRLMALIQFIRATQMPPAEKQKALKKFEKLYNNWRGSSADFSKLARYESIMR